MKTPDELETACYMSGNTDTAALHARIAELESEVEVLEEQIENDSLSAWEIRNGSADEYKAFFFECFERLGAHYPAPSVTSDYDKSVIFEAIEKGELNEHD